MKTTIYLRITNSGKKGKALVRASTKPDYSPIEGAKKFYKDAHGVFYPTVSFAMEIDIPDDAFKKAEKVVAKLNLETEDVRINEVKVLKGNV